MPSWNKWLQHQNFEYAEAVAELAPAFAESKHADLSKQAKRVAYSLALQIQSRIATQPLHFRDGNEASALTSVHKLFEHTRGTIEENGIKGGVVADLAWEVMNEHVRPFTAHWHKRQVDGDLDRSDDARRQVRGELNDLQSKLKIYASLLRFLADSDAPLSTPARDPHLSSKHSENALSSTSAAYAPLNVGDDAAGEPSSDAMYESEMRYITARRNHLNIPSEESPHVESSDQHAVTNLAGVAFSGGGIRSFTVCLGVMQRLADADLVKHFDFMSTVSGGSYLGTFLASFWHSQEPKSTAQTSGVKAKSVSPKHGGLPLGVNQVETDAVRHVRNNSKSLLAGGLFGQLNMVALLFAGIVGNLIAVLPIILGIVVILNLVSIVKSRLLGLGDSITRAQEIGQFFGASGIYAFGLLIVAGFFLLIFYRFATDKWSALLRRFERWVVIALFVILASLVVSALVWCYYRLSFHLTPGQIFFVFLFLPLGLMFLAWLFGPSTLVGRTLLALVGVSGPILFFVTVLVANDWLNNLAYTPWLWGVWLLASIFLFLIIDVNWLTPLRYYRDRLVDTYMISHAQPKRDDASIDEANIELAKKIPLSTLCTHDSGAPYPIINAAVNVPTSKKSDLRGRNSDFFVFTPHYIGSPITGYCTTHRMEGKSFAQRFDLGTAMAVSGAAASSHMGVQKQFAKYAFWLTFVNARLGYWLPNPHRVNTQDERHLSAFKKLTLGRPGALCLIREMLTIQMDEKRSFVNLSDGGHIENLGIYELLRRRCKFIVAIDAEADPDLQFPSLNQLIRYARIDFDIDIKFPYMDELRRNEQGYSRSHFTLGTIDYGNNQTGLLLYIKSTMTGNERDYIQSYQKTHPSFPHESTVDQFFDEDQFEAYRALGWHMADDLFNSELKPRDEKNENLHAFFKRLEFHLMRQTSNTYANQDSPDNQ